MLHSLNSDTVIKYPQKECEEKCGTAFKIDHSIYWH
jgi:hypothetical protein